MQWNIPCCSRGLNVRVCHSGYRGDRASVDRHVEGLHAWNPRSGDPGRNGEVSKQFGGPRQTHREVLDAAVRVVAQLSGLKQLTNKPLQIRADAAQGVIAEFA